MKEPFPRYCAGITKDPRTGVPGVTLKVAALLTEVKFRVADCVAMIIVLPAPVIVTLLPLTVATAVLPLAKLHDPEEVEVGGVREKEALPYFFVGIMNDPSFGTAGVTVKVALVVAERELPAADCVAVIRVLPAPTMVI